MFIAIGNFIGNNPSRSTEVAFSNPSPLHKVWRSGIERTGTITPPTGYTVVAWSIINHRTQAVVETGVGNSVTYTFTFASMEDCNVYDLLIVIGRGATMFNKMLPGEFTCLPQIPTVFDETWNTSGEKNGGWTDRPGYAIKIQSSSGWTNPYWWKSDDPTQPIHIVGDPDALATLTSDTWNFTPAVLKNVIIDGCADETRQYGIKLLKTGDGFNHLFSFKAEDGDADRRSENVIVCGIEADGASIDANGNTGFRWYADRNAINNEATYIIENYVMFNCYAHDTYEETYYGGQFNDDLDGSLLGFPYWNNSLYFRLRGLNSGNEVFQIGLQRNCNIFSCDFRFGGLRDQNPHENLVQFSGGMLNIAFFQNYLEQGEHNLMFLAYGRTSNNIEIFSNIMITDGVDADGGGNIWMQNQDVDNAVLNISHNTFINTNASGTDRPSFTIYEDGTAKWNKINITQNLIVTPTLTDYEQFGLDVDHLVIDNYKVLLSNVADVLFIDYENKDFHLSSLLSPAFDSLTETVMISTFADYDYEGYEFTEDVAGTFSGTELIL